MEYIKKCEQCNKEFTTSRVDTKCCSSTCRSLASRATDKLSVATDKSDYTRKMVEDRLKDFKLNGYAGDDFIPNWYKLGFSSRNHCLEGIK
jgi:hypothetical protein